MKNIHYDRLKVSHNPELVDLFLIDLLDELIGSMTNIHRCDNYTADNEDICTCLECILDNVGADTACSCDQQFPA